MSGYVIGYSQKVRRLEEELDKQKEELKKEVEAEFVRGKQIALRKQIYSELVNGNKISKIGTNFVPRNELGVILLFGRYHDYLGFQISDIHSVSPDCLATKNGEEVKIEFEYASSNFITHAHDPKDCDLVVCWEKDEELPIEVLELSSCLAHFIGKGSRQYEPKINQRKNRSVKTKTVTSEESKVSKKKREKLEEVIREIEEQKASLN